MLKELGLLLLACVLAILLFTIYIPYITDVNGLQEDPEDSVSSTLSNIESSKKLVVPIFKGICSMDRGYMKMNTNDKLSKDYIDIPISYNQKGGVEFSYSFWLRRGTNTNEKIKNMIIFSKGAPLINPVDKEPMKGYIYQHDGEQNPDKNELYKDFQTEIQPNDPNKDTKIQTIKNNRLVKCPLVRFGESNDSLRIELNTLKNPHLFVDIDSEIFGLLKSSKKLSKYNLITFSVKDNVDFGGIERGIRVDVYIDDALVKTQSFENNALMTNDGPMNLFPSNRDTTIDVSEIDVDIADLTYYNFAMNNKEVEDAYKKGFTDGVCKPNTQTFASKSKYHKVNLFNETRQI